MAAMLLRPGSLRVAHLPYEGAEPLFLPGGVGDGDVPRGVADDPVGRTHTIVLLDEQAVGEHLQDMAGVRGGGRPSRLDLDRDDRVAFVDEDVRLPAQGEGPGRQEGAGRRARILIDRAVRGDARGG